MINHKWKIASLFSGIGGFEKGIIQTNKNVEFVFSSEIDPHARKIYKHNYGVEPHGDITKIKATDIPNHDILCGGFPCQAFSIAGLRRGFEDTRGTLFFEIMRIVKVKRPILLFLENVAGLLSHDDGRTFGTILRAMDEMGYDAEWQCFNSKNHGVPQNRERVFIIGHLRGAGTRKIFPVTNNNKAVDVIQRQTVNCLTTRTIGAKTVGSYIVENQLLEQRIRTLTPTEFERLQGFEDGYTNVVADSHRFKCLGNAVTVNVIQFISERIFDMMEQVKTCNSK